MNRNEKKQIELFAKNVKAHRERNKLTQAELAARLDVDARTVQRMESGTYNPSLTTLVQLAELFSISVKDLI
jgi:DNA-binding XRE family transcriptional regulator